MRVGIVGAGLAGLAAARDLRAAGHQSFIFEKSSQVGGRVETVRAGGYAFDSGATSVAPRGLAIETVLLRELPQEDLVEVVKPIYVHRSLRVGQGDPERNLTARYVYRGGLDRLPILLAKGLDVRLGVAVEAIDGSNGAYRLSGETFDAVILTPP
ncbi:MAG: FAD-dependent oxidoreductase, partial [Fimbriimonas ginsengisoli]|nr:FAD-dependent oxidoreductase [Fimbriimonas ginsengisoli]